MPKRLVFQTVTEELNITLKCWHQRIPSWRGLGTSSIPPCSLQGSPGLLSTEDPDCDSHQLQSPQRKGVTVKAMGRWSSSNKSARTIMSNSKFATTLFECVAKKTFIAVSAAVGCTKRVIFFGACFHITVWSTLYPVPVTPRFCKSSFFLRLRMLHCSWDEAFTWQPGLIPFACLGHHRTLQNSPSERSEPLHPRFRSSASVRIKRNCQLSGRQFQLSVRILSEGNFYNEKAGQVDSRPYVSVVRRF